MTLYVLQIYCLENFKLFLIKRAVHKGLTLQRKKQIDIAETQLVRCSLLEDAGSSANFEDDVQRMLIRRIQQQIQRCLHRERERERESHGDARQPTGFKPK